MSTAKRSFLYLTRRQRYPNNNAAAVVSPAALIDTRFMATSSSSEQDPLSPSSAGRSAFALRRKIDEYKSKNSKQWRTAISTKLSHAGLVASNDENSNNPLSPPLDLATTYERPPSGDYGESGLIYSRSCNPTRKLLEDAVGQLEMTSTDDILPSTSSQAQDKAAPTFAFSSGMAAVASLLLACKSPVKVLIPTDVYHGVPTQLHASLNDHGVAHESVDMTNCNEIQQRIEENIESSDGSLIVWVETPSNPLCQITDIQAVCNVVQELRSRNENARTILTVVDSTWAPPCITQPLSLGADAVLHSGTKYLGGHSDVLLGTVSCSPLTANGTWLSERLKAVQTSIGATASPLECWLTLRGLRTLHLRVERQCQTAMKLAEYLNGQNSVIKCHYPGLESHPQHAVAKQQMVSQEGTGMFGGMLSFEVEGERMAMAVAGAVRIIRRATSLGGTETLIEHRASIEPPERRTSPPGLLRMSVGLEDANDLIHDLEVALDVASQVVISSRSEH